MTAGTSSLERRPIRILLFALVWFSCVWFGSWEMNPNNTTRLFAALSIVEDGDATIDQFAEMTIDKAMFDGHYYLDKAPGVTLLAVPYVALAEVATGETSAGQRLIFYDPALAEFLKLRMRIVVAGTIAVLTALAAVALFELGVAITASMGAGLFAAIGFALATPIWGWSTTLFGHAPVASLLVIATWAIERGMRVPGDAGRFAALAGLVLGFALVVEHSALLPAIPIGLYALWRMRGLTPAVRMRAIGLAVAGGIVGILPLLGYNLLAFGTPFRLGYQGVVGWEGMNQGLFGLTYPKSDVLIEILFGTRRGILWVAPIVALGAIGIVRLIREPARRDLGLLAAAVVVTMFLYNASYVYWDGGNSTGPRHAMPAMGFLALGLAPLWASLRTMASRVATLAVLAGSLAINLMIASAEITAPGNFEFALRDGVMNERFRPGYLRTIANEWFGWTPWSGLLLYLVVAGAFGFVLIRMIERRTATA